MTLTDSTLRSLPKVELHVHLEGTIDAPRIATLAEAVGEPLPRPIDELFVTDSLSAFLDFLDWTVGLVRSPETAADLAYEFAQRASADGTIYSEVIINPTHWGGLGLADLCEGVAAGFDRAVDDGLAECNILLSILRQQPAEEAEALATFMIERRPHRVVGLSIDGNESAAGRTGPRFARAYAMAGEAGFGLTAHAGESSGADGVRDALDLLGVHRIDHGVRAIEDDDVVHRLVEENTTLNVCVSSNCRRMYPDIGAHPIGPLLEAGVPVTLNTDDPAPLFNSLTEEFVLVAGHFDWSLGDAATITRTAIAASFCTDATKAALTARLDEALAALSYPLPHAPGSQPTTVT